MLATSRTPFARAAAPLSLRALVAIVGGAIVGGALGGCVGYPIGAERAKPLVLHDAERDLDCPAKEIRVVEGLGGNFEAVGCGRTAKYKASCDGVNCIVHKDDAPPVPFRDRPPPGDVPR